MAMFIGYFEVSVNFNVENRKEKFITLVSILYLIYRILIRSPNLLSFLRELFRSFLREIRYVYLQGVTDGHRANILGNSTSCGAKFLEILLRGGEIYRKLTLHAERGANFLGRASFLLHRSITDQFNSAGM